MFVDSHCHLNFPELAADLDGVISRMRSADVGRALCVSVSMESLGQVLEIAERLDDVWASAGVHPDHTEGEDPSIERLEALLAHPRVIATGETGLDYYRLTGDLEWQRERFRTHIRAARKTGKPLIIHTRAAAEDTLRIMREEGAEAVGGVMHCFTETWETASAAIDLGFMISFSGILTFKNAVNLREVARKVPEDRLLIETDAPYLAPVPHRGRTNEPSYVRFVAEELGRVRSLAAEAVAEITTANFFRLFRLAR
ncbi:MAG: TatD family hydrolase [Burkholderiales bacterium]